VGALMATTDLIDYLPISDAVFKLQWQQEISPTGGGTPRGADLGEELWLADIACSVLTSEEARTAEAMIDDLRGVIGSFYVWNPRAPYPLADPNGTALGTNAVTIYALGSDSKSLRLAGLPVGYQIKIGDFFSFDTGSSPNVRRCLHRFTAAGIADGAGRTPMLGVVPHLRAGVATALAVALKKPSAEMFILPGSFDPRSLKGPLGSLSFQAMQVP
jgi:hypothetical protein